MEIAILTGLLILAGYLSAYDVVSRCPPSNEETWTQRGKKICKSLVGQRYHCFESINGSFVEMCITPTGFRPRDCPYFDPSSSSNFQYRKCNMIYGQCPPEDYYSSYNLYKYTACLYSPTTVAQSSSDYNTEMTQPTQPERKQRTKGILNMTATTEPEIRYVTILRKIFEKKNSTESAMIFVSDILKGILTFTGGMLIASVCFITYVIKRKKQSDLRMTYSNAVAFKDNTENIYDDIAEAPLEIQNNNTSSLEQSAYLEPNEELQCHADTFCHRADVSEKENTDMQLCDAEMEKADNTCNTEVTEVSEVKDTAPSLLGFL